MTIGRVKLLCLLKPLSQQHSDLLKATAIVLVIYAVSAIFDLAEHFTRWAAPLDAYELDELPVLMLALALASVWFSHRRMREIKNEMQLRAQSEHALARLAQENQALARHAMQVQEEERRFIARELHDDMGQYLTAIRLDAAALASTADAKAASHAQRIISHTAHIQSAMKGLLHRLRHAALDAHGLLEALKTLVEEWKAQHLNIHCELALDESCNALSQASNIVIFRVVQEALTNIARHAQASHVSITLAITDTATRPAVQLQIRDDGMGFKLTASGYGFGLTGMRERVEGAGGTLHLINENGLQIHVNLPL